MREANSARKVRMCRPTLFSPMMLSVAIGAIIILLGIVFVAFAPRDEFHSAGGGVVFIGPIPIFFGGQGLQWLAIVMALFLLILYFGVRSLRAK